MENKKLTLELKKKAKSEGFALAGIASIPGSSRINLRTKALERWLEKDYHGEMKWMEADRRKNIESLLIGAKSEKAIGIYEECIKPTIMFGFSLINKILNANIRLKYSTNFVFEEESPIGKFKILILGSMS